MPQDCFERCPKAKCHKFFTCPDHWGDEDLAELQQVPNTDQIPAIEPEFPEDGPV